MWYVSTTKHDYGGGASEVDIHYFKCDENAEKFYRDLLIEFYETMPEEFRPKNRTVLSNKEYEYYINQSQKRLYQMTEFAKGPVYFDD